MLLFLDPSSHDLWLEVHKLPRDTWVSDLDTMAAAIKKKEEKEKKDEMMSEVNNTNKCYVLFSSHCYVHKALLSYMNI